MREKERYKRKKEEDHVLVTSHVSYGGVGCWVWGVDWGDGCHIRVREFRAAGPSLLYHRSIHPPGGIGATYPRFIRSSISLDPDCAGMCTHDVTFAREAITSSTSSQKYFGCGDVYRTRRSVSISATRSSKSAKVTHPSRDGRYTDLNTVA